MALKKSTDEGALSAPAGQAAWGQLAEKGEACSAVRFETGETSITFPYHCLKRWELVTGSPESLTLKVDAETVQIRGHGLATLRDALEAGTLKRVRVCVGRPLTARVSGGTVVLSITVTKEPHGPRPA